MSCHFLLQGIFPTQRLNLLLVRFVHCRQILYCWAMEEAQQCRLHRSKSSAKVSHYWGRDLAAFPHFPSFNPHNNPMRGSPLLSPLDRESWSTEKTCALPKATQLADRGAGSQPGNLTSGYTSNPFAIPSITKHRSRRRIPELVPRHTGRRLTPLLQEPWSPGPTDLVNLPSIRASQKPHNLKILRKKIGDI